MIVLDCSYTLALVLPDEQRPQSLERTLTSRLVAPAVWPFEVANALRTVVRRRRLAEDEVPIVCSRLETYQVDVVLPVSDFRQYYQAASQHGLSAYDAAYIDLALQRRFALATRDADLAHAAQRAGLQVLN